MRLTATASPIIAGLRRIKVNGAWCRAVRSDLLDSPTAQLIYPFGAPKVGARFTRKGGAPSIYLASDMVTALAEVRAIVVGPKGTAPLTVARSVWSVAAVDVDLLDVLDLTDAATQKALGTTHGELVMPWRLVAVGRVLPPTHLLGEVAYSSGEILALKAPSAKQNGGTCMVAFYVHLMARRDSTLEVRDQGRLRQRLPPLP